MKVLHLRSSARFVGLERLLLQVGHLLPQHGYVPAFAVLYRRPDACAPSCHPLVETAIQQGFEVLQVNDAGALDPTVPWHLAQYARRAGIDLIHCHDYKTDAIGLTAARLIRRPAVATVHGYVSVSPRVSSVYKRLDLFLLRLFDRVVAVSTALRRELVAAGVPEARTTVVLNAVDAAELARRAPGTREAARDALGLAPDVPLVVTVARLIPGKGHRTLIEAARQVRDAVPGVAFLLVGDGPLKETLTLQAAALGLHDTVSFYGYREDVPAFLRAADVFVLPSLEEGLPVALLEAMALGCPVIATAAGGVPEVVEHARNGLLAPPGDSDRLATAIVTLLGDRTLAAQVGAAGQARAERDFSVDAMARKLAGVYDAVLGKA